MADACDWGIANDRDRFDAWYAWRMVTLTLAARRQDNTARAKALVACNLQPNAARDSLAAVMAAAAKQPWYRALGFELVADVLHHADTLLGLRES